MQTAKASPQIPRKELEAAKSALAQCQAGNFGDGNWKMIYDFNQRHYHDGGMRQLGLSVDAYDRLQQKVMEQRERHQTAALSHEDLVNKLARAAAQYGSGANCIDFMSSSYAGTTQICAQEVIKRLLSSSTGHPKRYLPVMGNSPYLGGPAWIGLLEARVLMLHGPFEDPKSVIEDLVNNQGKDLAQIGLFVPATDEDVRKAGSPWGYGFYEARPTSGPLFGAEKAFYVHDFSSGPGTWIAPSELRRRWAERDYDKGNEVFAQRSFVADRQVVIKLP